MQLKLSVTAAGPAANVDTILTPPNLHTDCGIPPASDKEMEI